MLMFPVYVTASYKWGGGQAAFSRAFLRAAGAASLFQWKFKCQKAMKKADAVKPPPSCLAFFATTVHSPSTRDRWSLPKVVPAAAFLNAHRNIGTAYTFGSDGMETIMSLGKDWWGKPCNSFTNLQWQLSNSSSQVTVDCFPLIFKKVSMQFI